MEDTSRQLIQQTVAGGQLYYEGRDALSSVPTPHPTTNEKASFTAVDEHLSESGESTASPVQTDKILQRISSLSLPSHNTRWSPKEDELLREGLEKFGYGSWKTISGHIGTRNPLQCKNHARHWKTYKREELPVSEDTLGHVHPSTSVIVCTDPNIAATSAPLTAREMKQVANPPNPVEDFAEQSFLAESLPMEVTPFLLEKSSSTTSQICETMDTHMDATSYSTSDQLSNVATDSKKMFERNVISEEEKRRNSEWFCGKPSRTPERYLKIRNGILDGWQNCCPQYLTKTHSRKRLLDCGDVNAIGRVHGYLESVGAINVGCVGKSNVPRAVKRTARRMYEYDEIDEDDADFKKAVAASLLTPRKKKARSELATWDDPDLSVRRGSGPRPKRVSKRPQSLYAGEDFGHEYDPFCLVPLEYYHEHDPAPFLVKVSSDALLVMDFHSHLAYTEIIGLLGGTFTSNEEGKQLHVQCVFPCRSMSTGIQCEMDPESEMMAREVFEEKGLQVVGWYHSHPKFEPSPSVRDIENQTSYQTLFQNEITGDEPFIGVIVTPFDPEMMTDQSQIEYLHISQCWNTSHSFRLPYACEKRIEKALRISPDVMIAFRQLVNEYKDYEFKTDMTMAFGAQKTRLNKLLDSLKANVYANEEDTERFLENVRQLVTRTLIGGTLVDTNVVGDSCVANVAKADPVQDAGRSLTT